MDQKDTRTVLSELEFPSFLNICKSSTIPNFLDRTFKLLLLPCRGSYLRQGMVAQLLPSNEKADPSTRDSSALIMSSMWRATDCYKSHRSRISKWHHCCRKQEIYQACFIVSCESDCSMGESLRMRPQLTRLPGQISV